MSEAWYVCKIKSEISWDVTAERLERQGFHAFMPVRVETTYSSQTRKKTIVHEPLYPGYMFAEADITRQAWRHINSSIGVQYLLPMNAEIPTPVPTEFIDELRNSTHLIKMIETTRRFLSNEVVKVISGPLMDLAVEQRIGRVVSSGSNITRVALPHGSRGEIIAKVPNGHLAHV